MTPIDEIKARIDIVELVSQTVQLRRSGKSYSGFCPFHSNTRTPAFVVFPDSGTWRCFGQCNEGGDIFKFVMKKEGWDFAEALRYLAERAGVQLKPPSTEEQAAEEEHGLLRILLEEAVTFYRSQLLNSPEGKNALEYLRQKRGLRDETLEAFGIGYAPRSYEAFLQHFRAKGYSEADMLAAGMLSERESEAGGAARVYDRFRHRVMFPIRDERGRMAGFGARILNPEDVPKFLNSPQTAVFDKGRLLYGLDRARKAIRAADQAVIVEGYLDVIALHQAGFSNVISPMGTALTEHQLFLLKRYSRRIVLALDPDAAGDKATLRGLQVARQSMDRQEDVGFDARGLVRQEGRLQADIRVTTLPEGLDPDEVVNRDPKEWERIIKNARPVVIHVMETLAIGRDLNDPKVKNEIAAQVLPLIEDVPGAIERDTYRQRLARLLRVDERALVGASAAPAAAGPARRRPLPRSQAPAQAAPQVLATSSSYWREVHCLGVLLRRPDLLYKVDRRLQEDGLNRLSPADFQHAEHQNILRLFQHSVEQDMGEPLDYVFNHLSLPMMEIADEFLERTQKLDPNDDRVLEDLMRTIINLRLSQFRQDYEYNQFLLQDAQERGDENIAQYQETMVQLNKVRQRLDIALGRYTSRAAIVRQQ
jgi:DNA primase